MNGVVAEKKAMEPREMPAPFVVAVVATYNRRNELADLLRLLSRTPHVDAIVVADNAADPAVRELTENFDCCYLAMKGNPGVGPALNRTIAFAFQKWNDSLTHFWVLDDDVRFAPDTLEKLLGVLHDNNAQFVVPLIVDPSGEFIIRPRL